MDSRFDPGHAVGCQDRLQGERRHHEPPGSVCISASHRKDEGRILQNASFDGRRCYQVIRIVLLCLTALIAMALRELALERRSWGFGDVFAYQERTAKCRPRLRIVQYIFSSPFSERLL